MAKSQPLAQRGISHENPLLAAKHLLGLAFQTGDWLTQQATHTLPLGRHDGLPFHPEDDKWRKGKAGLDLPLGILQQIKGDWDYFAATLHLNHWRSLQPCWMCSTLQEDLCNPAASTLLTHEHFLDRARVYQPVSAIFQLPALDIMECVTPDYMHTVDLGVGQDLAGGLFYDGSGSLVFCQGLAWRPE